MENANKKIIDQITLATEKISEAIHKKDIVYIIEELLKDLTDSEFATFMIYNPSKQQMECYRDLTYEIPMIKPSGLLGKSFLKKETAIYNYIASEKYYNIAVDNPREQRIRSQFIVPVVEEDNLLGMARVCRSIYSGKHFSKNEIDIIEAFMPFLIGASRQLLLENKEDYIITVDNKSINEEVEKLKLEHQINSDINSTMLFLANSVHDIRTPAHGLYGFLEMLEEHIEDKRLLEFIENAKESAGFINTLTDSILQQVKETYQVTTSKPQVVNSVKFFAQIGELFSANMCKKNINYAIGIYPTLPKEIRIDTLKLKRVIINLIGNAYKFTPSGKSITFSVACDKKSRLLHVSVEDTGVGISKSRQHAIFESFVQAEENTTGHFGGTGLGLAISSQYVKDLGGELKLESKLDEGSTFDFSIPIEKVSSEQAYERIYVYSNIKITILHNKESNFYPLHIKQVIEHFGITSEKIVFSSSLVGDETHLIIFQHQLNDTLIESAKQKELKYIIVEENLFSLSREKKYADQPIISLYTYCGAKLYSFLYEIKKSKILLVDDNKINTVLLETMLDTEYCDTQSALDGHKALEMLKMAAESSDPYEIIFLDDNLSELSGTELLQTWREIEKTQGIKPIFAVSTTGNPNMSEEKIKLYNLKMNKPFKKEDVKEALRLAKDL